MHTDNGLMESSQWEGLTVGETWSCPMDGAMLSKSLLQFSVEGWGCVPSLLFDLLPYYGLSNDENGNLLQNVQCVHRSF